MCEMIYAMFFAIISCSILSFVLGYRIGARM